MPMKENQGQRVIEINLENIESRGVLEAGNYQAEVKSVELKTSQSGNQMLVWKFKVYDSMSDATSTVFHNTSLLPQALFNLKNLLIALGAEVPNGTMHLELDEYVGAFCGVTLDVETYDKKTRNRITNFFPLADEDNPQE